MRIADAYSHFHSFILHNLKIERGLRGHARQVPIAESIVESYDADLPGLESHVA